jgi:hypothetical protein
MQLQLAYGLSTKLRDNDTVTVCLLTIRLGTRLLTASSRDAIPSKLVDKYDTDVPEKPTAFIFLTLKMDAEFFAQFELTMLHK